MPNHFHVLVEQAETRAIEKLMRAILVKYAMYFNKKYSRTGHLFEGVYKGILIGNEAYLLHLSRYIHRNPESYVNYPYSSYQWYIRGICNEWFDPKPVLTYFQTRTIFLPTNILSYQSFVDSFDKNYSDNLKRLLLDL